MTLRLLNGVVLLTALGATGLGAQTSRSDKADVAALQGRWVLVSAMSNGKKAPDVAAGDATRTTHGDTTTVLVGDKTALKATFTVDTSIKPSQIEYRVIGGLTPLGTIQLGIYEIKGDILRMCISRPGSLRAREFVTLEGDFRTCSVWRRVKT